jgi:hypothetical protein
MSRPYYGIQLLDDIHTYFPDILYNPGRFLTVSALLEYIRTQTSNRFDLFTNAQRLHTSQNVVHRTPQQSPPRAPPPLVRTRAQYEVVPLNTLLTTLIGLGALNQDMNANFMDAVQVAPSAQQVERSTQLRGANAQDENAQCSICQDTFTSGQGIRFIRHCGHEFHRGCIDTWFQSNVHCPMCRWDIRDEEEEGEIAE